MYKEKESIPKIISYLQDIDYPSEKLDIKLVLEDSDAETYEAAIACAPSYNFEIIRVPDSKLRTKPKALNYAIKFARGEYITVFDADDIPEKTQLKKAIITFRARPKNVACLQARLNYYNANYTWLTRFFSLEYSLLFDFVLRGLQIMDMPLPLGGTSNHISCANLRELGDWDPFNVTEDADLGVRISALGLKTEMLDSYTMEEATATMPTWIRQRSRWIKGYMQTWLVHMRSPIKLHKTIGARGFWGFQFFIGFASFCFITAPIIWVVAFLGWIFPEQNFLPEWIIWFSLINLAINFLSHWFMMFFCLRAREEIDYKIIVLAILYPFYLIMHSIASYKALWQLIVKPHFWEKTMHGVAKQKKTRKFIDFRKLVGV
jgi:cellulose synthase/poly-beta-1,6-N-acetylglucosamine synthase-like glycosyltransferase